MATPRVLGQELRLTVYLCLAREASVERISIVIPFRAGGPTTEHPGRASGARERESERCHHTHQGLVGTATTSDDTNHCSRAAVDDLLRAGRKLDTGLALIGVVADDGDVVARGAGERATVTNLLLDVRDDGTLGHGAEGKDVANGQGCPLAGVDELAGVHAFGGDEGLGVLLELVGILEHDLGEGGATAGVVDDLLHNAAGVAMAFSVVEGSEPGRGLRETINNVRTFLCFSFLGWLVSFVSILTLLRRVLAVKIEPRPFL